MHDDSRIIYFHSASINSKMADMRNSKKLKISKRKEIFLDLAKMFKWFLFVKYIKFRCKLWTWVNKRNRSNSLRGIKYYISHLYLIPIVIFRDDIKLIKSNCLILGWSQNYSKFNSSILSLTNIKMFWFSKLPKGKSVLVSERLR